MVVYLCDKGLLESKEYRDKGSHTAEASAMISPQPIRTVTNYAAFTYQGHFTNESQKIFTNFLTVFFLGSQLVNMIKAIPARRLCEKGTRVFC